MRRLSPFIGYLAARRAEIGNRPPDRGGVAIIVALCAVILFGIAAWVIDGSALYQERRELQRGADFAALTVAADCARGDCGGATGVPRLTAESVVDANSTDGESTVPETGGVTFPASNQVKVRVVTFDARSNVDGNTDTIDYNFGTVFGKSGYQVAAEATATWDAVGGGGTLPLTLSYCEWLAATGGGATFPSVETTIFFHDGTVGGGGGDAGECPVGPAGQDSNGDGFLPAGFGWLNQGDCVANINVVDGEQWVARQGGNAPPNNCDPPVLGTTLLVPIFGDYVFKNEPAWNNQCDPPSGSDVGCYLVVGFAAFKITGFRFPGGQAWVEPDPPDAPCDGSQSCIRGVFTLDLCTTDCTGGGGNNFGATTVWLID